MRSRCFDRARLPMRTAATKLTDLSALSRNGENPDGRNLGREAETKAAAWRRPRPLVPGCRPGSIW
jgi:hypothetical protein